MSNGDPMDGFVFPPFIPPAAARPAQPAASVPPAAPVAEAPRAEPQSGAPRATMPWDVETSIVRDSAAASPALAPADADDLPWLEHPEPRAAAAEAPAEAAPAADEAFPDWLAWDDRDTDEARSEAAGVAPVDGLEDLLSADDLGGFAAAAPAVEWAEAAPGRGQADAADLLDAADASGWSLDAPEAAEPPVVMAPAAELTFESPAAAEAEPAFDVTLDEGVLTFAAVGAESPAQTVAAGETEPGGTAVEAEAVMPATEPFVADAEAVIAAEPDPFTAAAVHEAEAAAPADAASAAGGVFADVATRLEDIARTLRERPDDLLSGSTSDPLALLVAGYVMGYGARR